MTGKERIEARKLKGFRDFLPRVAAARGFIKQTVMAHAHLAGFEVIDTPAIEYEDVLLGSSGGETDKEVYRFTDHGDRNVALRFDLTVPFARYVTENYSELSFPFKRVQTGDVWRGEKPQKGRYRQFCQADLDIIGADTMIADVEVIRCLAVIIDELLPSPCTLQVNHRGLLSALINKCLGKLDRSDEQDVLIAIDKMSKVGREKVADLITQTGADPEDVNKFLDCLWDPEDALANLSTQLGNTAEVKRFEQTIAQLKELISNTNVKIIPNLAIARGLGYYTGIVFETTVDALPKFGSIASGGRYDNLVGRFGKHDLSGVGGSIGVDRLLAALEELEELPELEPVRVFVAIASEEASGYGLRIVDTLRREGIAADIDVKSSKLANQFKYADKRGYPYVITVGNDELAAGVCRLKDMRTGKEQPDVQLEDLPLKVGIKL